MEAATTANDRSGFGQNLTHYHAKYFAYELTKRCPSDSAEKLAGALVDAQVDLNPHQVEAALFAFRSLLSRGALLADEAGLAILWRHQSSRGRSHTPCRLVATEFSTGARHGGRIDTPALSEENKPVIIEYKNTESA